MSRGLHWLMAALFAWQFAGALLYVGLGDTALTRAVGGSHFTLGFTLLLLALLRGGWGLLNLGRRPPHAGRLGRAAVVGHGVLYGFMIVVPVLGVLHRYGSGKPFSPYGLPLVAERSGEIAWVLFPAKLHPWLAFLLLALVTGHAAMAVLHRTVRQDDVLARMLPSKVRETRG